MKKMYLALVALGLAIGTNAQTWVLTNAGGSIGKLRSCTASTMSANPNDFKVWITGDNHSTSGRKYENGSWTTWNTAATGTIYQADYLYNSNASDYFLLAYGDAKAMDPFSSPTIYPLNGSTPTPEKIVSATWQDAGSSLIFGVSDLGYVYNNFSGLPQVRATVNPLVAIQGTTTNNKNIVASRDGYIYIVNGSSSMMVSNPTSFNRTKGFRALGWNYSNAYVVVGDTGTIQRSIDGGATWYIVNSGTTQNLNNVQVNSETDFIVVGDNGTVRKTTDGGVTWSTVSVPTQENLNDIIDMGGLFGVIVGDNGVVLTYGLQQSPACAFTASASNIVDATNNLCNGQVTFTTPNPQSGNGISYTSLLGSTNLNFIANTGNLTESNLCTGNYIVRVVEIDDQGNEVTCADTLRFTVGGTPFVQTCDIDFTFITSPENATSGCNGKMSLYFTSKDAASGQPVAFIGEMNLNFISGPTNIINQTGFNFSDTLKNLCAGTYSLEFIATNRGNVLPGCKDTVTFTIGGGVGIADVSSEISLSIFPNPAKNILQISATETMTGIEIVNLLGATVIAETKNENHNSIDISRLSTGVYLLKVNTEKGVAIKRFIKE